MRGVFDFVRVISESASTVLVTGESGTGKEVIANLIHHLGPRRHMPFVPVGCALFSETLNRCGLGRMDSQAEGAAPDGVAGAASREIAWW